MERIRVFEIQKPLRARYKSSPAAALVTDRASATGAHASDPFHTVVEPMVGCGIRIPVGVHRAIGGPHDAPTPGDLLCAALAACQDSTVRMVANVLGVELEGLEVEVTGEVDVRGTLAVDPEVPVGFLSFQATVRLRVADGTRPELVEKLRVLSERCCVVLQTLRSIPTVHTAYENLQHRLS
jgi:uncharacterized OsmC-like protein